MESPQSLLAKMTLAEKVSLCSGGSSSSTQAIERLGIPSVIMTDGPHGLRWADPSRADNDLDGYGLAVVDELRPDRDFIDTLCEVTCFPTSATTACSWDRDLLEAIGAAIGNECRHYGVDLLLAPALNIKRHPLTGRNYEYFSEDPCLAGELAAAHVKGVQSQGVGATAKHFACNNAEFERFTMSSEVDERALREIYLSAFERVVRKSKPWMVMSAYNKVNGVEAWRNPFLLTEILRDEWNFEGVVVSDWWSVQDRVGAAQAGLDLEMPNNSPADVDLQHAVEEGELEESVIDAMATRILTIVDRCVRTRDEKKPADFGAAAELAQRAAAESIVLLKNQGGLLPLDPESGMKIAVIGQMASVPRYQGMGCSLVNPIALSNALEAIQDAAGKDSRVTYAAAYESDGSLDEASLIEAVETAANAEVAIIAVGLPIDFEHESWDRPNMDMPEGHARLIQAVAGVQPNTVVVLNNGSVVSMTPWIDQIASVLEAGLAGQGGGLAIADILFGAANPSGKLAVTVSKRLEDTPAYLDFPGENGVHHYWEGIFVGYRYYDARKIEPLFPFGFGLSYTEFSYTDVRLSKQTITDQETLTVSCTIQNTGSRYGKEIVQLYVKDPSSRLKRPEKELKGFEKIGINPGQSQQVEFVLEARDFSYYDPALHRWVAESGEFDILIGASSRDILLQTSIILRATQANFPPFSRESYIPDFVDAEPARSLFQDFLLQQGLIEEGHAEESLKRFRTMFVPIGKALEVFAGGDVTEDSVDDFLVRVNQEGAGFQS